MRRAVGWALYVALMLPAVGLNLWWLSLGAVRSDLDELFVGVGLVAIPLGLYLFHRMNGHITLDELRDDPAAIFDFEQLVPAIGFSFVTGLVTIGLGAAVLVLHALGDAVS